MPKLKFYKIDKYATHIFNTKAEMLEYIKKSSFRKDEWSYTDYEMRIRYKNKKWIVWWE